MNYRRLFERLVWACVLLVAVALLAVVADWVINGERSVFRLIALMWYLCWTGQGCG